jgi:hypothetical protein
LESAVAYAGWAIAEKQKPGDELEARAIANALWAIVPLETKLFVATAYIWCALPLNAGGLK